MAANEVIFYEETRTGVEPEALCIPAPFNIPFPVSFSEPLLDRPSSPPVHALAFSAHHPSTRSPTSTNRPLHQRQLRIFRREPGLGVALI